MQAWLVRCSSFAEDSEADAEFWRRMSPDERVAILERMRQEWMEEHGSGDEGVRRTARRVLRREGRFVIVGARAHQTLKRSRR